MISLEYGSLPPGSAGVSQNLFNACYGGSGMSHCLASTQLVACAIANAIGKWIAPPVTPDKLLKALGKA